MAVALSRTMQTAGRTVAFSAATVAISLAALLLFPIPYLRSFAYAGVAVVAPRRLLGHRRAARGARRPRSPGREGAALPPPHAQRGRGASGTARPTRVMRHPVPYAVVVTAVLLVLAVPFLRPGDRARSTTGSCPRRPPAGRRSTTSAPNFGGPGDRRRSPSSCPTGADPTPLDAYAAALSAVDGVVRVDGSTGSYEDGEQLAPAELIPEELLARFEAEDGRTPPGCRWCPASSRSRPRASSWSHDLRDVDAPGEVLVGGTSAELVDTKAAISAAPALGARPHRRGDLRAAVPHGGQPPGAAEGPAAQRAVADRHLRGHGVDLPGRPPGRPARVHARPASST